MEKQKVLVTGANGMLGRAVSKQFRVSGAEVIELTREKIDLVDSKGTLEYLEKFLPDLIVHCAAAVGGIKASIQMGSKFFIDNTRIDNSVLFAARQLRIKNFIYIASSCMYPANREHPLKEDEILSGPLEPTNEDYAITKIVGSRLTQAIGYEENLNWRVFIPSNLYGQYDNFNLNRAHLLAAIIRKSVEARRSNSHTIEMWGDGTPLREFTHIDDFSNWIVSSSKFLNLLPPFLNVGFGIDYSVREFYEKVLTALNWDAEIVPNLDVPNGNMRKLMDSTLAREFGWNPKISIEDGIKKTILWYCQQLPKE